MSSWIKIWSGHGLVWANSPAKTLHCIKKPEKTQKTNKLINNFFKLKYALCTNFKIVWEYKGFHYISIWLKKKSFPQIQVF